MTKHPTKKRKNAAPPSTTAPAKASKTPAKKGGKERALTTAEKLQRLTTLSNEKLKTISFVLSKPGDHDVWSKPKHYISTRSLGVDKAMGIPGLPSGRFVEIYGPNAAGKSTLINQVIAQCQSMGGIADVADNEHADDWEKYSKNLGVKADTLVLSQVRSIEETIKQLEFFAIEYRKSFGPDVPLLFAWDSIAGTPTDAELAGEVGDKFRAEAAKVIRAAFRRATQVIAEHQVCFVATNQVYKQMAQHGGWGDGQETYGGDGPKYAASIRLDLFPVGRIYPRSSGLIEDDDSDVAKEANKALKQLIPPIGQIVNVRVVKNKLAMPHRQRRIAICEGRGVDNGWSIWHDFAGAKKLLPHPNPAIVKNSSWFAIAEDIGDYPSWQGGHFGLADLCAQHPDLWDKLVARYAELP